MDRPYLHIDAHDTIVVALRDLRAGMPVTVAGQYFKLVEDVHSKHKFALKDFKKGDEITMYGVCVGKATREIAKGATITTSNMAHAVAT